MRRALVTGVALLASACAVGPNFRAPPTPPAAAGKFAAADDGVFSADALPADWWRLYDDPVLDGLIAQAFAANTDLRVATANLRRARAILSETRSQLLPSTTISASANYLRSTATSGSGGLSTPTTGASTGGGTGGAAGGAGGTGTGAGGTSGSDTTTGLTSGTYQGGFYSLGLDASYELDLYGRVRRDIEASRADVAASAAQRDAVRVSVAAETARAYADACSAAREGEVAQQTLKLQIQTFDLTERLAGAGRGTPLDVARARAQLEQTRATLPQFITNRRTALFRLSVLTGHPPEDVPPGGAACTVAPTIRRPLPVGDGTAMIRRRPDIRQADRTLAAATARIGVATADLYPQISLGASVGSSAISLGGLDNKSGFRFNVGPLLSWTFPNFTVARARIRQAEAANESALASFDGTVLNALQETDTALAGLAGELARQQSLIAARDLSAEAARIVQLRYTAGAENFLAVLDAQRTLAESEAALANSQAALTTGQVAVFQALGGGWETAEPDPTLSKVTHP
ncbi:MAG: efflux transporter outer membrane subunit [Janthinobacterium lividum]